MLCRALARYVLRRRARLAGDRVGHALGSAAAGGGHEAAGRAWRLPALRLTFSGGSAYHRAWVRHAPLDVISEPASIEVDAWEQCDAWLGVSAPENTRDGADIPAE